MRRNCVRKNLKSLRLLFALLAVFALLAAACGDDDGDDTGSGEGTDTSEEGGEEEPTSDIRVGMVYDIGGRGDQSFNDAAYAGLTQAAEELGIEVRDLEPAAGGEDRGELLRLLADEGYDMVIGVGFAFEEELVAAAADYPDTTFAIVDAAPEGDNIMGLVFAEEQGSFLVGAAAALTSETGQIGFIGGVEIELIQKFEAGYVAGAQAVNPDIEVQVQYITQPPDFAGFNDPARGGEIATSMFEGGADVVYHAAGGSGGGLFEAAAANGEVWAIGVDSDQYLTVGEPNNARILTSMLKRVDVAVYEAITAFVNGEAEPGVNVFDLSVDGVGYSTEGGFLTDIEADLEAFKQQIVDGEIEVPTTP
jgi:basic membrane protein A